MSCILNLNNIGAEVRPTFVFYTSKDFIIYKNGNVIQKDSCNGELLASCVCPPDYTYYKYLEVADGVLIMVGGRTFIFISKDNTIRSYTLDPSFGICITELFEYQGTCVFGTRTNNKIQFLRYDYLNNNRICQTASWPMSTVTDIIMDKSLIYALLDNSLIVCCDMSTGKALWNKIESILSYGKLLIHSNKLLYTNTHNVKVINLSNQKYDQINIQYINPSSLLHIKDNNLYYLSNQNRNIGCYSLLHSKNIWEINGNATIYESIQLQGKQNNIFDVLLLRLRNDISLINASYGKTIYNIPRANILSFTKMDNAILVHKTDGTTEIFPGI